MTYSVAILTVSDRCSRGEATDRSGPALAEAVEAAIDARVLATGCVPDEQEQIAEQLRAWSASRPPIDLVLTTGGTGLSPRDHTPEATLGVLERRHAGLIDLIRTRCYAKTPMTALSRGEAGTLGQTLIINLPGSPRGALEWFEAVADVLPHAIDTMLGVGDQHHADE